MKIIKTFLGIITATLIIVMSATIVVSSAYAKSSIVSLKPEARLNLDFFGAGENATIYPLAHSKDEYLIVMHNINRFTAVDMKANYQKELTVKQLPSNIWNEQNLIVFLDGYFKNNKINQKTLYAFTLVHLSYNPATYDFTIHAKSFSTRGWSAFAATTKTSVNKFRVYIDPVPELGYSYHRV